jgi:hypothetical protein
MKWIASSKLMKLSQVYLIYLRSLGSFRQDLGIRHPDSAGSAASYRLTKAPPAG